MRFLFSGRNDELLVEMEADFDREEYLNYLEKYGR
jgi:hypothetical protein